LALKADYRLNFTFNFSLKITLPKTAFFNGRKFGVMCKAYLLPYKSYVGLYCYTLGMVKDNIYPPEQGLKARRKGRGVAIFFL